MRQVLQGAVIGLGLLAISAGTALAQADNTASGNAGSTVNQNNQGQTGGNYQLNDSIVGDVGSNTSVILSGDDVAVGSIAAQSIGATAVGGAYTEVGQGGNLATGDVLEIDGDLVVSTAGYAVEDGAATVTKGIAFGADFDAEDQFAVVGGDGTALMSIDNNLADHGSAIVVGTSNSTATAYDESAAVAGTGSALVVDDGDDWSVFGGDNRVSQNELTQEVATEDGSAIISVGAWTPETQGDLGENDEASNPGIFTGDIGGVGNGITLNMTGLNAFHANTGAMNQGSIHAVAVSADSLNLGGTP